ncbi:JM32 [macacine gammaherpesvirus 11]|uniref:JM32 n=2 Tax=macacine gammaherpesvirus 11 TaxID=2560570 RepID=G9JML0_9GAMA|nr:JM32 [Macaca fuscata rhadinovirus]AAT00009.1 JM32 [Macaca fuscata rhadinovirus]AEW87557.1 JM32 [Macaca fuscata rhadinovirus]AEW87727.1 JM32 [Macaca fuscata rhadinovirus]
MRTSEKCCMRYPRKPARQITATFWAPHPNNVLFIHKPSLIEERRNAFVMRNQQLALRVHTLRKNLLRLELDNVLQTHQRETEMVMRDLDTIQNMVGDLRSPTRETADTQTSINPRPKIAPQTHGDAFVVTIAPGDPGFTVNQDLRLELLPSLYMNQNQWLPQYGPWYSSLTDNAMQRRVFPRDLRGTTNFQNSTSLKLMSAVISTAASITQDFYADVRNVSDTQAALCLLNGYYCHRTGTPLPPTRDGLWDNLGTKLATLISHLKQNTKGLGFEFTYSNPKQRASLAPLNKETKYSADFFTNHVIYATLAQSGLLPGSKNPGTGQPPGPDLVYILATTLFSEDVPPFQAYQWNLRAGLSALGCLVLVYVLLELAQITPRSPHRRLNLASLLGGRFSKVEDPSGSKQYLKKGQLFDFLTENYISPLLSRAPDAPTSFLFPGAYLTALEAKAISHLKHTRPFVNLTGSRFNEIFDILNQKLTFRDAGSLIQAQTSLRLTAEEGLAAILSHPSPPGLTHEIMKSQFGVYDDYDKVYFLVLGYLPVATSVV